MTVVFLVGLNEAIYKFYAGVAAFFHDHYSSKRGGAMGFTLYATSNRSLLSPGRGTRSPILTKTLIYLSSRDSQFGHESYLQYPEALDQLEVFGHGRNFLISRFTIAA